MMLPGSEKSTIHHLGGKVLFQASVPDVELIAAAAV